MRTRIAVIPFLLLLGLAGCEGHTFKMTVGSQEPRQTGGTPSAGQACVGIDDIGRRRLVARDQCAGRTGGAVRR